MPDAIGTMLVTLPIAPTRFLDVGSVRRSFFMLTTKAVLILSALTVMSYAQITNGAPAVIGFVDLSTSSGTQILVLANQENIVTTVGNALFPAGNVRIGNNGVAVAGVTSGFITGSNTAIPPAGVPIGIVHPGLGGGTAPNPVSAILAFWDDLYTTIFATPPASVWWKEQNDVLYIMWKNEYHTFDTTPGQNITFEIQVFGSSANGAPVIQILYPDTTFGGSMAAFDHGSSATVGYVKGSNPFGSSAQWSFNTASVPDGTVLSIYSGMYLAPSSPLGPGSIQVSLVAGPPNGSYFLAVTLAPGAFPNGWLFGLDISYADLAAQLAGGFPFAGPLDPAGNVNIGPFQGLPPITTYAVAFGFLPGSPVPSLVTAATAHPIP